MLWLQRIGKLDLLGSCVEHRTAVWHPRLVSQLDDSRNHARVYLLVPDGQIILAPAESNLEVVVLRDELTDLVVSKRTTLERDGRDLQ
jgi:hypothetical protein